MNNSIPVIQQTTDYTMFNSMVGNRDLQRYHIERLKKSMRENMLFTIIFVNEHMQIIDGQHRMNAIMELSEEQGREIPIYYVMLSGYSLEQIQIYNENVEEWSLDDIMKSRAEMGDEHYTKYKIFKESSGLNHVSCLQLLTGADDGRTMRDVFRTGNLRIDNEKLLEATIVSYELSVIKEKFDGYNNVSFVRAYIRFRQAEKFRWDTMFRKLNSQGGVGLEKQNTVKRSLQMLVDYYDKGLRREDRILFVSEWKPRRK